MPCNFHYVPDGTFLRIVPEQRQIGVAHNGDVKLHTIARMEIVTLEPEQVCGAAYVLLDSAAYDAFLALLDDKGLLVNYGKSRVCDLPNLKVGEW